MNRRHLLATALLCGGAAALPHAAFAQDKYPSRPIRLIVPAAAGGSTDMGARIVAKLMGEALAQPVVVENKGGGGGRIGPAEVARAPADGYTLLYGNNIGQALLPAVVQGLGYDPLKNFAPVGGAFWYSTVIVCNPKAPFDDLKGLIEHAKKNPGKLNVATAGPGSGNHFSSELLGSMAGVKFSHVPYKGNAPATQDVVAGFADCIHIGEAKPYLDTHRLKAIATTGLKRDPRFPQLQTVDELGLKGFDATWWQGVFAPAGTPRNVMDALSAAMRKAIENPSVKASMFDAGFVPEFMTPTEVNARIKSDMSKFQKIAADAKIHID
ncbi:Bug family tripartite tricarboxylate transporter substrate binding protein [Hydrogenophaga sp. BPS33]|uniref:Bug family tripartite tricarboxylate transporter substrate binding protein n=1 Tax=Hydrogenophaga sp. BPS33 TaxID=2651974 RepID=UPI0013597C00|nr:tripartite tricarboxylate transporter substrate binding protein [Hydrogenophaga sp. BPS33]